MRLTPIPDRWIGIRKDWLTTCQSIGEALVTLTPEDLKVHALAIGSSGSGKSTLLHHLVAQDILLGHSIVVIDARGDFTSACKSIGAAAGIERDRYHEYNLREKTRPRGFSPLAGSGEPYYRALGFLDAIANEWDGVGPQTAEVMRNAVLLLAETKSPITLLESLFNECKVRRDLIGSGCSDRVRDFWLRYDELSVDRQQNLASPVLNKVSLLFATEGLRRLYGHPSPTDIGAHLNTPGSITLISLAVDELHSAGWVTGQLFLAAIAREIFARVEAPESMRNPLRIYVDEFEHFGAKEFESLLAEGRRFKCALVLAHQTLAQLNPKLRALVLGNVGVKVVFRTARHDADILNKDLAGHAKAFDLPNLDVGQAVLWKRNELPLEVEINAPLFADSAHVSHSAKAFSNAIRNDVPVFPAELLERTVSDPSAPDNPPHENPDLEDWL